MEIIDRLELLKTKLSKHNNYKLDLELEDVIEKYASQNNLCEICLNELKEDNYKEYRGEFWGDDAYETIYKSHCPICTKDK